MEGERTCRLTLERTVGEMVNIHESGGITVEVMRVQGKRVWLRFHAPASVRIFRPEIDDNPPDLAA